MNTERRDPSQFIRTEDRHDQARRDQIICPGRMVTDLEIVAAKDIQLVEALEARPSSEPE